MTVRGLIGFIIATGCTVLYVWAITGLLAHGTHWNPATGYRERCLMGLGCTFALDRLKALAGHLRAAIREERAARRRPR